MNIIRYYLSSNSSILKLKICKKNMNDPGKVVVASLNDTKKDCDVFYNYPLLCLFKLIAASPLINSYPTQMQKRC